jgi:hypothetical protein
MSDLKKELHRKLQAGRAGLLSKLEGLSEYDLRRPMTPTGTNLLGIIKHLAGVEYEYLGASFKRPSPETMSWIEDGSLWEGADMWATPDESSEYLIGLYKSLCARRSDHRGAGPAGPRVGGALAGGQARHDLGRPAHSDGGRDCPACRPCRCRPRAHRRARGSRSRRGRGRGLVAGVRCRDPDGCGLIRDRRSRRQTN